MSTAQTEAWVPADTLAARLILVRHQLGLTQREAAEQAGVGFGAWQSWESGRSPRNAVAVLAQVADQLKVRRDWLMFGGPLGTGTDPNGGPGKIAGQSPDTALVRILHRISAQPGQRHPRRSPVLAAAA